MGTSWTDKVMALKEEQTEQEQAVVNDDEWV